MNGGSNGIEKLSAYIIPTDDAHQVYLLIFFITHLLTIISTIILE